jgi:hypothetical protein
MIRTLFYATDQSETYVEVNRLTASAVRFVDDIELPPDVTKSSKTIGAHDAQKFARENGRFCTGFVLESVYIHSIGDVFVNPEDFSDY